MSNKSKTLASVSFVMMLKCTLHMLLIEISISIVEK